jgi:Xaa-Pro aminopeptidase
MDRLQSLMAEHGMDAMVVTAPDDTFYLSGAFIMTQELIPDRVGVVLVTRGSQPLFIVSRMEEVLAKRWSRLNDVRTYTYVEHGDTVGEDTPMSIVIEHLRAKGHSRGTIGVQMRHLAAGWLTILAQGLPEARFVDGGSLLTEVQQVKSPAEVQRLSAAARATKAAVHEAFGSASAGWTEKRLANRIATNMLNTGADLVSYVLLASGEHGSMSHWMPDSSVVRPGDLVRVDVMGRYAGYCSDYAWTAVAGEPSPDQARIFQAVVRTHKQVVDAVRPRLPAKELYLVAKRSMENQGLPFRSLHIGHGLGVHLHERPMIGPLASDVLEVGMTLNLEIFYRDDVNAGYHVEDLVLVTQEGHDVITGPIVGEELPRLGIPVGVPEA